MMRYAIAVVVEADDADKAWEEMGQMAGGTYDEFTMQFLGDPAEIAYQDEYTSREAANAILAAMPTERERRAEEIIPGVTVGSTEDDMAEADRDCAGGCGWELHDDEGPYCAECQQAGKDPAVPEAGGMGRSDGLGATRLMKPAFELKVTDAVYATGAPKASTIHKIVLNLDTRGAIRVQFDWGWMRFKPNEMVEYIPAASL
jgi:hypothetical protein